MHLTPWLFLFGGAVVLAHNDPNREINCVTVMGLKPVDYVKTVTKCSISTVTLGDVTVTESPTVTITGDPETQTETTTEIVDETVTEATVTDTYTSTSTETDTATDTVTETSTESASETETETETVTTTVPAPTDFVPIDDTINGFPSLTQRAIDPRNQGPVPKGSGLDGKYPQRVKCMRTTTVQHTITVTEQASTSTVTPAPETETETETITSTSTEVPRASTTETVTETDTITETATETETLTLTQTFSETVTATALEYEACNARNMVGPLYNGAPIVNVYNGNNGQVGGGSIYDNGNAASAVDCCVQCINKAGCTGTAFIGGRCVLLRNSGNTCGSQSANAAAFITGSGGSGFVLSNGLCGYQQFAAT